MKSVATAGAVLVTLAGFYAQSGSPLDLSAHRLIDLTHAYSPRTVYWPTSPTKFTLDRAVVRQDRRRLLLRRQLALHARARRHPPRRADSFRRGQADGRADPAGAADRAGRRHRRHRAGDGGSRLPRSRREDVLAFEKRHGRIPAGSDRAAAHRLEPPLARTRRPTWVTTRPVTRRSCRFPGFGVDAARLLVEERRAGAIGIDTASIDYGRSTDFMVHRVAAARNVPALENLTNLDQLPADRRDDRRAADEDRGGIGRAAAGGRAGQALGSALRNPRHFSGQIACSVAASR